LGLFSFSEWSAVLDFADELESSFHEFCFFFDCSGGLADVVVVFGAD
jgi:CRISPR/Cas system-associated protein Cas10 (large subunit of type III CRISPR-Cas system)